MAERNEEVGRTERLPLTWIWGRLHAGIGAITDLIGK